MVEMEDVTASLVSDRDIVDAMNAVRSALVRHIVTMPAEVAVQLPNIRRCLTELDIRRKCNPALVLNKEMRASIERIRNFIQGADMPQLVDNAAMLREFDLIVLALESEDASWVKCSTKRYPDMDEYVQVLFEDAEPQYSCVSVAIWRGSNWYDPMTGDLVEGITAWREVSEVPSWALPQKTIEELIAASSLGTPEAVAIRAQADKDVVQKVLARSDELAALKEDANKTTPQEDVLLAAMLGPSVVGINQLTRKIVLAVVRTLRDEEGSEDNTEVIKRVVDAMHVLVPKKAT